MQCYAWFSWSKMHEISIDTIWYFHGLQTYAHTLYTMGWNNFWRIIFISCTYLCFFVCLSLICPYGNWHLKYSFWVHFGVHSNNTNFRIAELWTFEPLDLFDHLFYLILSYHFTVRDVFSLVYMLDIYNGHNKGLKVR